jgi:hypothetical protein
LKYLTKYERGILEKNKLLETKAIRLFLRHF